MHGEDLLVRGAWQATRVGTVGGAARFLHAGVCSGASAVISSSPCKGRPLAVEPEYLWDGVQPRKENWQEASLGSFFYVSPAPCWCFLPLLLPRLANKNTSCPVIFEFEINNEYVFSISMAPMLHGCPVFVNSTS